MTCPAYQLRPKHICLLWKRAGFPYRPSLAFSTDFASVTNPSDTCVLFMALSSMCLGLSQGTSCLCLVPSPELSDSFSPVLTPDHSRTLSSRPSFLLRRRCFSLTTLLILCLFLPIFCCLYPCADLTCTFSHCLEVLHSKHLNLSVVVYLMLPCLLKPSAFAWGSVLEPVISFSVC